jgi:solute:Na+ symporter, SSS family
MVVGLLVMSLVVFARQLVPVFPGMTDTLTTLGRIAWPWYVLIGTTVTVGVGILSSLTHPQLTSEQEGGRTWK